MSLSASTVWECRSAGSDNNGGGFVSGSSGTDFSQQNAANSGGNNGSTTDAVANGSATITSATASFTSAITGNVIYLAGGSGSLAAGWYQATYVSSTSITVDRNVASGTGITMNIGGALGSPGLVSSLMTVNGMIAWIKYTSGSPFVLSSSTANVSGGLVSLAAGVIMQGYDQARGDKTGNQPLLCWPSSGLTAPGSLTAIYTSAGGRVGFTNLAANANSISNVCGFLLNQSNARCLWCTAQNCNGSGTAYGFYGEVTGDTWCKSCNAVNCAYGFYYMISICCYATTCTSGFYNCSLCVECLAYDNTTGFLDSSIATTLFDRCTADSNTTGFSISGTSSCTLLDCLISNNGTGINNATAYLTTINVANYLNSTTFTGTTPQLPPINTITLTAQPYMTPLSQFAPNATPGGGALLRGAATPVWGQTDDKDIGAVHSANNTGLAGLIMMVKGQTVAIH